MNYKKIFKSQAVRHRILRMLSFIPDKTMVRLQYRIKFGRWPNLKNPVRYTEKIQLYKLYYRNPLLPVCSDKYAVREYLEKRGYSNLLPRLYGVFSRGEDIDFEKLPQKFVIKTNDGGGGDNILICKDKKSLDTQAAIKRINGWLNKKKLNPGREWAYTQIPKSVILIEEFLENEKDPEGGIEDYKFFCFDGKIYCIQYDEGRYSDHRRDFYTEEWENMHFLNGKPALGYDVPPPPNFEEMKKIARELSTGFPHVRVDLYSVKGKIYFGELTFYTASGYGWFKPDEYDKKLGAQFDTSTFAG